MDKSQSYVDKRIKWLEQRIRFYHNSQRQYIAKVAKESLRKEQAKYNKVLEGDPTQRQLETLTKTLVFPDVVSDEFAKRIVIAHQISFDDIENVIVEINGKVYNFTLQDMERYSKRQIPVLTTEPAKLSKYGVIAKNRYLSTPHVTGALQHYIHDMILQGLSIDKIMQNIMREFNKPRNSALVTARTESTRVENGSRLLGYESADAVGVKVYKEWYATHDSRTRESHAFHTGIGGEVRELDEPFSNGGMYPCDPNLPPEESCNCRCVIRPNFTGQREN